MFELQEGHSRITWLQDRDQEADRMSRSYFLVLGFQLIDDG